MTQEQDIEKMEKGRQAAVIEAAIGDYITEQRERIVLRLQAMYRGGDISHDKLVGSVGELVALDNLVQALLSDQRLGNIAAERELNNASS